MENRSFEQIARKARTPYLANPARYHPTERSFKPGKHLIAFIVCSGAGVGLAYFTHDWALDAWRSIVWSINAKVMPVFYFRALIAYYTAALFLLYITYRVFFFMEERAGGKTDDEPLDLPYVAGMAVAMSASAFIIFFTVMVVLCPMPLKGKIGMTQAMSAACAGIAFTYWAIFSVCELFRRRSKH